ncbi:MAG TPA: tetratricopeptide repeat protein [Alphaproteobacteria bacterium]|jgi:hypothetical protein|nr:tetratricopeptide repeat protein [Alphaproteobacteria bacterium]
MSSPLDSLIEEVDEDLRRDRAVALFRRYGAYLIALALGIIIAVAAVIVWRQYKSEREMTRSTTYAAALDAINRGNSEEASQLLGQVTAAGGASSGYGVLARLQDGALKAKGGDAAGATAIYDGIAADSGVDPLFRDLARILSALTSFDTADPAQLAGRLQPLAEGNGPWRFSAKEISAHLALKAGDTARAKTLFAQIADDPRAPEEARSRAAAMASTLGS